jgi:hypothetical protein
MGRASSTKFRVGRKGKAKRANRDRLNAMANSEKRQHAEPAVNPRRKHFHAARTSPADESTQTLHVSHSAHHVEAQHSSASGAQEHRALFSQ